MDKQLAKLILDQGDAILPFLKLAAKYVTDGYLTRETAIQIVSESDFQAMLDSEYIAESEDALIFETQTGWLFAEPEKPTPAKKESNFDLQLSKIARILGYPVDFFSETGKYRSMFRKLLSEHGFDKIETLAYDNTGMPLQQFLTPSVFASLSRKFEANSR